MKCPTCGSEIPEGVKFCENCGTAIQQAAAETPASATALTSETPVSETPVSETLASAPQETTATNDGVFSSSTANSSQAAPASEAQEWGLKWHNVLKVLLILGALLNLANGTSYLSGSQYNGSGVTAEAVYAVYGNGLKLLDMFYGFVCFGLAVLAGVIVYQLHTFKKTAPTLLLSLYASNFGASVLYLIVGSAITGLNLFTAGTAGSLAGAITMFFVNKIYYDHRKHLFVN